MECKMSIFNVLSMIGGLALFLYGMHLMGEGLSKASGGKLESIKKINIKSGEGSAAWCRCYGGHPVVFGNDGYGCRLCQFRHYAAVTGGRHYYGCEYRYDGNLVDFKSYRN